MTGDTTPGLSPLLMPLARFGLAFVPPKRDCCAITLHHVGARHRAWFENVVDFIADKYGFLAPQGVAQAMASPGRVLLTFDDGFLSSRVMADEILGPRSIRALFFVTGSFVGLPADEARNFAQRCFYPARRLDDASAAEITAMDWRDVAALQARGHVIGAHTDSHRALAGLSADEAYREIIEAADRLEQWIGSAVRHFAYPFGSVAAVNGTAVGLARQRFDWSYANVRGGLGESPARHFLFRQNLVPGMPLWLVDAVIEGRLDWRYRGVRNEAFARFSERRIHR